MNDDNDYTVTACSETHAIELFGWRITISKVVERGGIEVIENQLDGEDSDRKP